MAADESGSGDAGAVAHATSERYVAFISYRHTDPDRYWAKWLHSRLETYRVPKTLRHSGLPARPGRVFRDEEELSASADLSERIDEALTDARFLIVVCSKRAKAVEPSGGAPRSSCWPAFSACTTTSCGDATNSAPGSG
jgi:hypothetical protein